VAFYEFSFFRFSLFLPRRLSSSDSGQETVAIEHCDVGCHAQYGNRLTVSSRFAETRFAEIRVRGWCLPDLPKPDSPKPDSPKPVSPKLGFRVRVRVGVRLGLGFRVKG